MKIAYLLNWELSSDDGVTKKVAAQTHAWQALNHQVKVFCIARSEIKTFGSVPIQVIEKGASKNIIQEFNRVYTAYSQAFASLVDYGPDIVYFRFDIYQPALRKIFRTYPVVIEMNSNDEEELKLLAQKGWKGKIRYAYHLLVRNSFLGSVAGFCCVTNEIARLPSITKFKKPVFVVPNSIRLDSYSQAIEATEGRGGVPNLVFMGTPNQSWHGVDKIIELAKATEGRLLFQIIGIEKNPQKPYPANIHFHGYLQKQDYEKLLLAADIGVCTLALHRKNMEEASPLKTREYLAYGLPIIVGYQDTAFMHSSLPDWVLQLPNTENNVALYIDQIVAFCDTFCGKKLLKEQTRRFIDSSFLEQVRLESLRSIIKEKKF